ncbi:MAG: class I SAM-dependent methyltransferase, partial [Smithellaceae bacterium]
MKRNRYFINTTDDYHIHHLTSLGWELTVCNALADDRSPCRKALQMNASYGEHLCRFLEKHITLSAMKSILEVGGGLGYLMRDFLMRYPQTQATMLDISPYLLQVQKKTLADYPVTFQTMDFLQTRPEDLRRFDLVILNENLGDFPTLVCKTNTDGRGASEYAPVSLVNRLDHYLDRYGFSFAPSENINIGALDIVDKLTQSNVPCIYLSEHSCEASPQADLASALKICPSGNPERIALKGHAEYTIKFS